MQIGNLSVENPLFLAPMAGVTDWAFRTVCARLGAGVTVTEMVSSRALVYKDQKTAKLLRKNEGSLCGAQIFGNDPEIMAQGARLALEISGCDFLDINMGCPMPKIANSGDGSGLGWDKGSINVLAFTKRMEDAGAAMVTVHGRTRSQLYSGVADWDMIRKVKAQLSIPVIANGDITGPEAALRCAKWTGADGLMIGRSCFGDPWIFQQVKAAMAGEEIPQRPVLKNRIAVAVEQFQLAEQDHGEHVACLEARKHFAWYLRGVSHSGFYKQQISSLTTMEDIYRVAKEISRDLQ